MTLLDELLPLWDVAAPRRRFRLYWTFVGPASGWIRREMLRAVRLQAEQVGDAAKPQSAV